jgi:hypothetical protein
MAHPRVAQRFRWVTPEGMCGIEFASTDGEDIETKKGVAP